SCFCHTNMRVLNVILLAVVLFLGVVAAAAKNVVLKLDKNTMSHEQFGEPGKAVHGRYAYEDAQGTWHTVNYKADHTGFHVLK
ncbi:chitin-binding domain-containing protein, partial [Pseudomonas aeruginosa]